MNRLFFWLIFIIGVGLRLYHVWTAPYVYANSDTCLIWLMARHILEGEFPLFCTGDYYGGPLESLTIAFFFMIFGIREATLYLGTIFYSGLFIVTSYFLGKEIKDKATGLVIMLFASLPPSYFFWTSIVPYCYIIETLLLGNVVFLTALRIPQVSKGIKKTFLYMLLGACAGIGTWTHYIILYYLVPAGIYLLLNEKWKSLFKNSIPALMFVFISAFPFWVFNLRYNFISFKFPPQTAGENNPARYLFLLLRYVLSMFGLDMGKISIVKILVFGIYMSAFLYFLAAHALKKKKSIFTYLFIFMILFYSLYRSKVYTVESYYYVIPFLIFACVIIAIFISSILQKNRIIGLSLLVCVLGYNLSDIKDYIIHSSERSASNKEAIYNKIRFFKENGIYRYIGHEGYAKVTSFFSNEEIIASGYMEYEYTPYADIVESADKVAFEEPDDRWRPILDKLCTAFDYKNGYYFNFEPFKYEMRIIDPAGWKVSASENKDLAKYAFDRNIDNTWGTTGGKKDGLSFTLDLGRVYTICKIEYFNFNRYQSYPEGCRVEVSLDGKDWQGVFSLETIQPFFWSGPRIYWRIIDGRLEWIFNPVKARFVRIIHKGENKDNQWVINELYLYEFIGIGKGSSKDYVKDAKDIINFMLKNGKVFIYADYWLSAKARGLSQGKVDALVPYNSYLPLRENMSREVILAAGNIFAVRREDASGMETILNEFQLPFRKLALRRYILYYFEKLDKKYELIRSLFWAETNLIKQSLSDYSLWLYNQKEYKKALRYYPNNFSAHMKISDIPLKRFFPEKEKIVVFKNNIKFLGYSIRTNKIVPGKIIRIEYFWEIKGQLKEDISVFVHFIKNGKIIFQNDHEFLYQFARPLRPLPGERFREILKLKIPEDTEPGIYRIIMGLWDKNRAKRVYIYDTGGKKKTKVEIGELIVNEV